jgi:hypothetical protein
MKNIKTITIRKYCRSLRDAVCWFLSLKIEWLCYFCSCLRGMWLANCKLCGHTSSIGDGIVYLCVWDFSCRCVHILCQDETEFTDILEMISSTTLGALIPFCISSQLCIVIKIFKLLTDFWAHLYKSGYHMLQGHFLYFVPRISFIFLLMAFSFVRHCNFSNCRAIFTSMVG